MSTENETLRSLIRDVTNIPEAGYYMPQSWHDQVIALSLSGKLDAPVSEAKAQGEYGDAYQGAREDLAIWKRRALEAEKALQEERIITERLGNTLNEENGPTFMGEPVLPAKAQADKPSYASQMAKRWESIMPAAQPKADPCPKCIPGTVCRTPKCGRLRAQHQPIGIDSEGGSHD